MTRTVLRLALLVTAFAFPPGLEAQSQTPRFERADCLVDGDWSRAVRRECGWLVVPESRDRPSARTIRLAVEIFRAQQPSAAPRVFLHGGPGGQGGIRLYSAAIAQSGLIADRDIVVYDQRGAGLSEPALCPGYDAVAASSTESRRACIAELQAEGVDRYAYHTAASVADLIDLRRALGYASWDVYGVSYGARLAQEAMARDGAAIRSVVLASPASRSFSFQGEQPLSTQRALERVFLVCSREPDCREAFPEVAEDFYALYEALTASPIRVPITRPDRTDTVSFDGSRFVSDIRNLLLNRSRAGLGRLPLLLHELRRGDRDRAAREIVAAGSANETDRALRALVNCSDHATHGTIYRSTLDSINALVRPPFRRGLEAECEDWLPQLPDEPMAPPVRSDIPTLILTAHFDDRTPTEQARRIAAALGRAYLVEFPDETHDARPSACHAAIVAQFYAEPTKSPDTSCVGSIPPIPFATAWEPAARR